MVRKCVHTRILIHSLQRAIQRTRIKGRKSKGKKQCKRVIDDEEPTNSQPSRRLNLLDFDGTTEQPSSAGGDETDFLSGNSGARDGGGFSDMLVVSSSVRMVHRVHGHTTGTGPATRGTY